MAVLTHLQMRKLEISSARAYVDCLGDSVEDLEHLVVGRIDQSQTVYTALSIGVAAAAAIAAGTVELINDGSRAAPVVGIGGGTISSALAIVPLISPSPTVRLEHEVNVLRTVWYGGTDKGFSRFIWELLSLPRGTTSAPRDILRAEWQAMLAPYNGADRQRLEQLLFGSGGEYSLPALRLRDTMLDYLETEVDLLNQDFERLVAQVVTCRNMTDCFGVPR